MLHLLLLRLLLLLLRRLRLLLRLRSAAPAAAAAPALNPPSSARISSHHKRTNPPGLDQKGTLKVPFRTTKRYLAEPDSDYATDGHSTGSAESAERRAGD